VSISFGGATADFSWTGKGWARVMNGTPHVDGSGQQVAPTNLIVQFTNYGISEADDRSPEAIVTGSGDAWVFSGGQVVRGRWNRKNDAAVTTYTDADGNLITLLPGTTWIELPRPGRAQLR
jgi:hypothetical protein